MTNADTKFVVDLDDAPSPPQKSEDVKEPHRTRIQSFDSESSSGHVLQPLATPKQQAPAEAQINNNPSPKEDKHAEMETPIQQAQLTGIKQVAQKNAYKFSFAPEYDPMEPRNDNIGIELEIEGGAELNDKNAEDQVELQIQNQTTPTPAPQNNLPEPPSLAEQTKKQSVKLGDSGCLLVPTQTLQLMKPPSFVFGEEEHQVQSNHLEDSLLKWSDYDIEASRAAMNRSTVRSVIRKIVQPVVPVTPIFEQPNEQGEPENTGSFVHAEETTQSKLSSQLNEADNRQEEEEQEDAVAECKIEQRDDLVHLMIRTQKNIVLNQVVDDKFLSYLEQYFLIEFKLLLPSRYKKLFLSPMKAKVYTQNLFSLILTHYPSQLTQFVIRENCEKSQTLASDCTQSDSSSMSGFKAVLKAWNLTINYAKNKYKEIFKQNYWNSGFAKLHKTLESKVSVASRISQARDHLQKRLDLSIKPCHLESAEQSKSTVEMLGALEYLIAFDKAERVLSYKRESLPKEPKYRVQSDIYANMLESLKLVKQEQIKRIQLKLKPLTQNLFAFRERQIKNQVPNLD